jgi:hypothetical protein
MGIIRDPAGKLISSEAVAIIGMQRSITSTITMRKRLLFFMIQSPFYKKNYSRFLAAPFSLYSGSQTEKPGIAYD